MGRTGVALAIVMVAAACGRPAERVRPAQHGVIDLTGVDLTREVATLDGDWGFHWQSFVDPAAPPAPPETLPVPGTWRDADYQGKPLPWAGYGSYHLRLRGLPVGVPLAMRVQAVGTAYVMFVDGRRVGNVGTLGTDRATQRPSLPVRLVPFVASRPEADVVLHVANHYLDDGGIWMSLSVGPEAALRRAGQFRLAFDLFMCGALVMIGLYHLALFAMRRSERSLLWFGLFCILFAVRQVTAGERLLYDLLPDHFALVSRANFLSFYLGMPAMVLYLRTLYPAEVGRRVIEATVAIAVLFALVVLATPPWVYSFSMAYYQAFCLLMIGYVIVVLGLAAARGRDHIGYVLGSAVLLAAGGVNDMLISYSIYLTSFSNSAGLGMLAFALAQALLLSFRFSRAYRTTEALSAELMETNQANGRFVPTRMLELMHKTHIRQLRLGDQVTRDNMSILFLDIRDFTGLAEKMSGAETFQFLNSFLRRMGPLVRASGGYVDKYIGDAFLALFPDGPNGALEAAVRMAKDIPAYNQDRARAGYDPIRVGIGIHHGSVILGAIGEAERMEGTVISDAVNLASRLENLTKMFDTTLLVSADYALRVPQRTRVRRLGSVRVRGRREPVEVMEVLDALDDVSARKREDSLRLFEGAVRAFERGDVAAARVGFTQVIDKDPQDGPALFYMNRVEAGERGILEPGPLVVSSKL